jgi:RHS repeat-associated protein
MVACRKSLLGTPLVTLLQSGSMSFQPTYSLATNHMTSLGSNTPTYDANGNVTNDFLNSYAWDANARPITIDGVGATYDALGRMVELNKSGTYTQFLYSPTGFKMQILNGQANQAAFVPLPGGALVEYSSVHAYDVRHADWLGNSRFASTFSRTMFFDTAYAPFGAPYAQSGTTDLSFTGMDQDTAANVYDFPAREYGIQGRWPSPDPAGVGAVDPTNPQTWNRYAYAMNNPLSFGGPGILRCRFMPIVANRSGNSSGTNNGTIQKQAQQCVQPGAPP